MSKTILTVGDDQKTLILERTFAAPRSKVWAAFTDPDLFVQWWGPHGWSTTVTRFDFREGGDMIYCMKCEDERQTEWFGKTSCGKFVYGSIDPESSFAYTDYFTDEDGNETPGMPSTQATVEFIVDGDSTRIVSKASYDTAEALAQVMEMGMEEGIKQTWERLADLLEN